MKRTMMIAVLMVGCGGGDGAPDAVEPQRWCPVRDQATCSALEADFCGAGQCTFPWDGPALEYPYCIARDQLLPTADEMVIDGNWFERADLTDACADGITL